MIKVYSVIDSMDVNGEFIETVSITFQKFSGLLAFNVTIPLVKEDVDVPFEDISRKDLILMARAKIAASILEGTEAAPVEPTPEEPPTEPEPEELVVVPEVDEAVY